MLTQAWFKLRYHEQQARLWRTKARFVAVAAGRGSGKTETARRRVIRMLAVKRPWPNPMFFYALPTYKQARRVAWRPLLRLIPPHWLKGNPNETEMRIDTVFGSSLYVVGMDKPQRIEGDQWDGGIIDESSDQRPNVFNLSVLPALSHRNGWCWRIGVPKRFGVGAAEFKDFFFNKAEEAYTWLSGDILTPEQLRWARENLDPKDFNEQYNASWEDPSGMIFYAYSSANVATVGYRPDLPLIIGSDFNVDPMAWVVGHHVGNELHIIDEFYIRNTNTQATLNALYMKYGTHNSGFEFYGDASGRARNTRATLSDYMQIKGDTRFNRARVFYPKHNPARKDRFAACNALLRNAAGETRLLINPRCKNLIHDLEVRCYKEGTNEPDDGPMVGHITDGLGYIVHAKFPIKFVLPGGKVHIA